MRKYVIKRLAISAVTMLFMMVVLFLILQLMPGSPFNDERLDEAQRAVLAAKYGLDKPVGERLVIYIGNLLHGDFGVSYNMAKDVPVTDLLADRIGVSLWIGFLSLAFGTLVGIIMGFISAFWQGRLPDHISMFLAALGLAAPSYAFAILFCYYLGYKWGLVPLIYDLRRPLSSATLPMLASAIGIISVIARFTRDTVISVLQSDYVLFAKSQGIRRTDLVFNYILRNSMLPIITVMGSLVVSLLTGTLVLESIFAVPGIGSFMGIAIAYNDYNVILALSFIYSLIYVVVMLIVDIMYGILDPRIRIAG